MLGSLLLLLLLAAILVGKLGKMPRPKPTPARGLCGFFISNLVQAAADLSDEKIIRKTVTFIASGN